MHHLGDMQHCFGRNTAHVEAGATEILFLDDGHLCAKLSGANGGNVATWTSANHCDIIVIICHKILLRSEFLSVSISRKLCPRHNHDAMAANGLFGLLGPI